ncbi:MAG: hypothetical protein ACOX7O_01555 [Oscillospiraceae bacterium]|jgi:hypothetical protein
MNMRNRKTPFIPLLRGLLGSFTLFVLTLSLVMTGLAHTVRTVDTEIEHSLEDGIRRAAVSCYALEGAYPESLAYLKEHYDLSVNEDIYAVHYAVFASNIMPEITVIKRQG